MLELAGDTAVQLVSAVRPVPARHRCRERRAAASRSDRQHQPSLRRGSHCRCSGAATSAAAAAVRRIAPAAKAGSIRRVNCGNVLRLRRRPRRRPAPATGDYSLARQLGLRVARVVIDPGHGGHDPGAQANGVTEAELVLDVALRLEKLLSAAAGRRSRAHPPHQRIHPARGTHGHRQSRGRGPVPVDSRERAPAVGRARHRNLLPQFRDEPGGRGRRRARERRPASRRWARCRRS